MMGNKFRSWLIGSENLSLIEAIMERLCHKSVSFRRNGLYLEVSIGKAYDGRCILCIEIYIRKRRFSKSFD